MTHRFFRLAAWGVLAALVFITISPIGLRPHTMTSVGIDRAGAYAFSGMIFAFAYPRRFLSLALFLIAAAFAIEALQWLSPTRHPKLPDATVKALGSVVGLVAGKTLLLARRLAKTD